MAIILNGDLQDVLLWLEGIKSNLVSNVNGAI